MGNNAIVEWSSGSGCKGKRGKGQQHCIYDATECWGRSRLNKGQYGGGEVRSYRAETFTL